LNFEGEEQWHPYQFADYREKPSASAFIIACA
jgi:hypothetical protein